MSRSNATATAARRTLRKTGRAARRNAPAAVAVLILAALVGTSLAGVIAF